MVREDRTKSEASRLTVLPMALAYCQAAKVLRPFIRDSPKPTFLAIIVVEVEGMAGYFETASEIVLTGQTQFGIRRANISLTVKRITPGKHARDQLIGAVQSGDKQVVLIFSDQLDVPAEYRTTADIYHVVKEFSPSLFKGAIYRVCQTVISESDALYARSLPMERLAAAFRTGRSAHRSLQLLRQADIANDAGKAPEAVEDDAPVGVEDLIGYGEARSWGLQLIKDLKLFEAGKLAWRDVDPGLLLSGPSGTGKTRFAQALAHSTGLPLIRGSAAQWQAAGHLGDMLREARATFREATESAPCILLIDEMDSFGDRTQLRGEYGDYARQVINGMLELMDGAVKRPGVVLIGTTNYPDHVDSAMLRPGRMDHHIRIAAPNATDRLAILVQRLKIEIGGPLGHEVADLTEDWTGAQLEQLSRRTRRKARELGRSVVADDILAVMPESVMMSPDRLYVTAIHECGHAVVGAAFGNKIRLIKIADRYVKDADDVSLGRVEFFRDEDARRNLAYYLSAICILLGGIAAECEVLGDHGDGAGGTERADLAIATRYATLVESTFGMGETLVSDAGDNRGYAALRLRDNGLWERVDALLKNQMQRAREIISLNRGVLDELTTAIIRQKKMNGDQLGTLLRESAHQIRPVGDGPQSRLKGMSR